VTALAVAVVTDSTSDLDPATAARCGIDVVPLFVNFGEERFRDGVDLSHAQFYERLRRQAVLPTTSQPTSAMFEEAFRPHVDAGREIVCVTINAKLSGTINAATAAAQQFPGAPITIVDSAMVSGGLAVQAMHAADLARDGAAGDVVAAALERDRDVTRGYVVVPDLSHAVRTGRVSRAQAFIGSLVKVLPVLRMSGGAIEEEARVRTYARAQDAMIDAALRTIEAGPGARVVIAHAEAPDVAAAVAARLRERITQPVHALDVIEAGPAIATHAGAGAVGIFVLPG
jgi:DegV family protein with EDD domain